jgi:uncharacterized membrane protein
LVSLIDSFASRGRRLTCEAVLRLNAMAPRAEARSLRAVVALIAMLACLKEPPPPAATVPAPVPQQAALEQQVPQQPVPPQPVPPQPVPPQPAPPQPAVAVGSESWPENRIPTSGAKTYRIVGVTAGAVLHLRTWPDDDSPSLVWIPPGATNVIDMGDEGGFVPDAEEENIIWRRVAYAGRIGWVDERFLHSNQPPSSSPAPELATGTKLGAIGEFSCFGARPSWSLKIGDDGSAQCEGACAGAAGLRAANVSVTFRGDVWSFDVIDARDQLLLSAKTRVVGKCRVGKSRDEHYYEVTVTGERGPLRGCCDDRFAAAVPTGGGIGHARH